MPWPCQAGTRCPPPSVRPFEPWGHGTRGRVEGGCCTSTSITVIDGGACGGCPPLPLTLSWLTEATHSGGLILRRLELFLKKKKSRPDMGNTFLARFLDFPRKFMNEVAYFQVSSGFYLLSRGCQVERYRANFFC